MIELKLYVSEMDYEAAVQLLTGGGVAGSAAAMAARVLPDGAKEELAAKYINASAAKLQTMLEQAAASKGVHVKLTGAQAAVVRFS